jgi:hypothetical protein
VYGSSCSFTCEEGYRVKEVSNLVVRSWTNECSGQPDHSVTVGINSCAMTPTGKMVSLTLCQHFDQSHAYMRSVYSLLQMLISAPDASDVITIAFFETHDCSGRPEVVQSVSCGSVCSPMNERLSISVSCIGPQTTTRSCQAAANADKKGWLFYKKFFRIPVSVAFHCVLTFTRL